MTADDKIAAAILAKRMPPALLSIAVGLLAWSQLWAIATPLWQLPAKMSHITTVIAVTVWLLLVSRFGYQWFRQPRYEWQLLQDPQQSAMTALLFVSSLLAAMNLQAWSPQLSLLLFASALLGQMVFGLWWMGRFWQGGRNPGAINASIYLPAVAQNLVAANAAASFGFPALASLLFGAGIFSWLALESLIMQRAALQPEIAPAQRPIQGIQIAPAVVAGVAYLTLTAGSLDLFAKMLLGYGIYQLLLAARLLPWTLQSGAISGYWAFSFGVVACALMSLQFTLQHPDDWHGLAVLLFAFANTVVILLACLTGYLLRHDRVLISVPNETKNNRL
jgi:tellurite resistance protein